MVDSGLCGLINRSFRRFWLSTDSIIFFVVKQKGTHPRKVGLRDTGHNGESLYSLRPGKGFLRLPWAFPKTFLLHIDFRNGPWFGPTRYGCQADKPGPYRCHQKQIRDFPVPGKRAAVNKFSPIKTGRNGYPSSETKLIFSVEYGDTVEEARSAEINGDRGAFVVLFRCGHGQIVVVDRATKVAKGTSREIADCPDIIRRYLLGKDRLVVNEFRTASAEEPGCQNG